MHPSIHPYLHTYIHAYIHTYLHTSIHASFHTSIHTYKHTYIHLCVCKSYTYFMYTVKSTLHIFTTDIHTIIHSATVGPVNPPIYKFVHLWNLQLSANKADIWRKNTMVCCKENLGNSWIQSFPWFQVPQIFGPRAGYDPLRRHQVGLPVPCWTNLGRCGERGNQ